MGLIATIVIGFIVGLVARAVMPGNQPLGLILTAALGIAGSIIATYAGQAIGWYQSGQTGGFIAAVVGALVLLFAYRMISKKA